MKQLFTKKLVMGLLCFAFLGALQANAQTTVILNEDFSGGSGSTPPTGWTNNILAGDPSFDTWRFNNPCGQTIGGAMSGQVAVFDSDCYSSLGGGENVALESPTLNTTNATLVVLEYDVQFETGFNGAMIVEVYNGSSWVAVKTYGPSNVNFVHETIDVSTNMANVSNAKIRFRWTGNYSWWVVVDNAKVTQTIPQPNDITIEKIESFQNACGLEKDTLALRIKNVGTADLTNIGIDVTVTGSGSASHSIVIPGPFVVGKDSVIKFPTSVFNTLNGGTFNVDAQSDVTGDGDPSNNDILQTFIIDGTPAIPTTMDVDQCGTGAVTLTATKGKVSDQLTWYDANLKVLAQGTDNFTTAVLPSNQTYTYYVDASNILIYENFDGTTGSQEPANWDQQTLAGDPTVDTWRFNNPSNRGVAGNIVAPFAIFDSDGYSVGGGAEDVVLETPALNGTGIANIRLEFDELMQSGFGGVGQVEVWDGASWNIVYSNTAQINSVKKVLDISSDAAGVNGFKVRFRWLGSYSWWWIVDNVKIVGGGQECRSEKEEITVTVKGLPTGASAVQATPFEGTFNAGNVASPDIVTAGDEINYEFAPPTGFTNADHGSTWQVIGFTFASNNGVMVPMADYIVDNPGVAGNGKLKYTPSASWIDSTVIVQLSFRNLGPTNGCDSTVTRRIFIAPKPDADFNQLNVCLGDGMAFDNLSTISTGSITYKWDFGDGTTSTLTNPIHRYNTFGNFDVKLITTSNYGYKDSSSVQVTVFETPDVKFSHQNACEDKDITLTNNTTIGAGSLVYTWDFGDGSPTSSSTNETHLYTNPGEYLVTLTAEANNCKSSIQKSVFQFPQPDADYTFSGGDCNDTEIDFISASTIAFGKTGHFWDFGDNFYTTEVDAKHTFADAGVNDVKLVVTSEFGCRDSVTKQVVLKESPIASFTNTQVCDIDPVEFTNTSTVPSGVNVDYTWDFGDGNSSILTNPTHNYTLPLKRTVVLTATGDNGCVSTAEKEVQVGIQPQADFDFDPVCEAELTAFINKTTISRNIPVNYEWFVNGTSVSNVTSLDYVFNNDGVSKVKLVATADDEGACKDEIEKDVQVDPTPDCNFTVQSAGNGNRTTNFTVDNPESNVTYDWQFGDGEAGSGASTQYKYLFNNLFRVILIATAPNGCNCSDTSYFKATTVSVPNVSNIDVDVYPNPNKGNFTVKIGNAATADIEINVYNALGQVVYTLPANAANAGGEYSINMEDMPAGVYTVKVQSGADVYTTKINIVK